MEIIMMIALWCGNPSGTGMGTSRSQLQVQACRQEVLKCLEGDAYHAINKKKADCIAAVRI